MISLIVHVKKIFSGSESDKSSDSESKSSLGIRAGIFVWMISIWDSSSLSSSWIISLSCCLRSILKDSWELLDVQVVTDLSRRILLISCLRLGVGLSESWIDVDFEGWLRRWCRCSCFLPRSRSLFYLLLELVGFILQSGHSWFLRIPHSFLNVLFDWSDFLGGYFPRPYSLGDLLECFLGYLFVLGHYFFFHCLFFFFNHLSQGWCQRFCVRVHGENQCH